MSENRKEALQQTQEWLQRNKQLQVIEESHTTDLDEYFVKDEDGYILQIYISDRVTHVNELGVRG